MLRKTPLLSGETYHIYNRGAHKYATFTDESDYWRFSALLHLANHSGPVLLREILERKKHIGRFSGEIFTEQTDKSLVDLLAYSLMPNHFHFVIRQKMDNGITKFMQKLTVSYSMYFNTKYEHSGVLFQGRFKSSHLGTDPYFKWIFSYIHLNPVSLVEPQWKEKGIGNPAQSKEFLRNYRHSSYYDYYVGERPERAILAYDEAVGLLDKEADLQDMLAAYVNGRALYSNSNV
ncbi:transposase [Candidatus Kaiserbacteria bacterium]|nr:transposase [Candidatus Kaiserbacteria bacterium]